MLVSNRQVALEFLNRFSSGRLDEAAQLMVDDLQFAGPADQSVSSTTDVNRKAGRMGSCRHKVINLIEDGDGSVTVLYEYEGAVPLMIAQWFSFENQRIVETDLAYEPKRGHQDWSTLVQQGARCSLRPATVSRDEKVVQKGRAVSA